MADSPTHPFDHVVGPFCATCGLHHDQHPDAQHEENQAKLEALALRYAKLPVRLQTGLVEALENSILAAEYAVRTRRDQDETDCPECQRTGTVTQVPGTLPVCRSCDWTGWVNVPEPPS